MPLDIGRLIAEREALAPIVAPFLEPDEQPQIVIRARGRPAMGIWFPVSYVRSYVWPFFSEKARYLLVATDRAWLVLEGGSQWRTPFQLRYRGSRDVRIAASWWTRFDGFDQPYAIDPMEQDKVHAANDALDAARQGQTWDLADAEAHLATHPRDAVSEALGVGVMKIGRFVPKRPKWLQRLDRRV